MFNQIPQTFIFQLEIDPMTGNTVNLNIAPVCSKVCAEDPVGHPNLQTKQAINLYAGVSNVVCGPFAPCGYTHLQVEDGSTQPLQVVEYNSFADCLWFAFFFFCCEPLIVPKTNEDLNNQNAAYFLGMFQDCVQNRSFVAIFGLNWTITGWNSVQIAAVKCYPPLPAWGL